MQPQTAFNTDGIAIIGMSCRFPQAKDPEKFWQNLRDGKEFVTEFSKKDLLAAGVDPAIMNYPGYVNTGIVLEDIDLFDAAFFGFSPRDAEILDPQQRIFLECAWEALESSGYDPESYEGLIGVYAGVDMSHYLFSIYANLEVLQSAGMYTIQLNNDKDYITTRVAYKLNLKGPAVTVQATCATSLVAIAQACQSLLSFQCDIALAGGSAITLPQKIGYFYQEGGIASPDGHCRAFDAQARGTTGGSGAGIVVLKRLEEALNDGDHIHAIIRGFGINNDGADKVGYTAPSVNGQAEAIAMAQAMADVHPETITYIEAHGTGTKLGDPIEINALTQAFRNSTSKKGFCGIGSVKTNIGHCNSAAGVAGIIKTVLALKHKMLPASLHFTRPNPNIDFANSPFYVVSKLKEWEAGSMPRRAGVSSFGIGGTNAHIILEEAPEPTFSSQSRKWQLMLLSAKTFTALDTLTATLIDHLKDESTYNLADIAYTLQVGRREFQHRRMLLLPNEHPEMLKNLFHQGVHETGLSNKVEENTNSIVFMFPGQGAQYVNMGLELYQQEPLFKEQVDYCCEQLMAELGLDLRTILYPDDQSAAKAGDKLKQTSLAQPALFVIEYALARLWMAWGVKPHAMIGHSVGELVAACLAGVFSLEDALQLIAYRGKLMQQLPGGAMSVVYLPKKEVSAFLDNNLSIAAVNTPSSCVVSGPFDAIEAFEHLLDQKKIAHQRLITSHAFHSKISDSILAPFTQKVETIKLHPPLIPYLSNTTGTWITPESATDPAYWAQHIRHTVQFSESVQELLKNPSRIYVEVGPGNSLCTLLYQHQSKLESEFAFPSLPHPKDKQADEKMLINTLGQLWLKGVKISWPSFYTYEERSRVPLPTYPFERERFWIDPTWKASNGQSSPQRKKDINQWLYTPYWKLSQIPSEAYEDNLSPIAQCWLIFTDSTDVGTALNKKATNQGKKVFTVLQRDEFFQIDEYTFGINSSKRDHYSLLFRSLLSLGALPDIIVHLWNFTNENGVVTSQAHGCDLQKNSFHSLLYLAQALTENNISSPLKLKIVSNHLHKVHGLETVQPEKAMLLGACKVIVQELPNIACQSLDIDLGFPAINAYETLTEQLMEEITYESSDSIVAYRHGKRWIQSFKPVTINGGGLQKTILRKGGVYLITGGLGGIGIVLAKYIGKKYKAKLILTGRSPFPAEAQWAGWLTTHQEDDAVSQKIRQFQQLQEVGAELMIVSTDVTEREQMQQLSTQIIERFGKLNGIIHSAGVAGGGIIAIKKEDQAMKVIDPKVKGTQHLEEIFGGQDLDFFVLCSSLSAVVGGVGQIDYCSANNFLDAFAHGKNSRFGTRYTSINWDTWGEVGMAVNTEVPDELKQGQQEALRNGIRNEEGVQVFEHILTSNLSQMLVSTADLMARIEKMTTQHVLIQQTDNHQSVSKPAATHVRPMMSTEYVAADSSTELKIAEIWVELLGIDKIGIHDNFLELGGHSLLAIQLTSRLRTTFNIEFSVQSFFESPTIAAIASVIDKGIDQNQAGNKETNKPSLTKLSREKYRAQGSSEEPPKPPENI